MGNELGLLVPGVKRFQKTANMAQTLGIRKPKKRKSTDYRLTGERQKTITREMLLRYLISTFKNLFPYGSPQLHSWFQWLT